MRPTLYSDRAYVPRGVPHAADAADVAVLAAHWNRYLASGHRDVGLAFAERMRRAGKRLLVFFDSDSEEPMPFHNAIVFRPSLHRSRRRADELALPAWSGDLVDVHLGGTLPPRPWREQPVIGFCGAVHRQPPTLLGGAREAWLRRRGRAADTSAAACPARGGGGGRGAPGTRARAHACGPSSCAT
jgi:hypothetical protein